MKVRLLYGKHVGEPIRNLEGTHWETGQNEKNNPSRPPHLNGIKARHIGPSHCLKGKQILLSPPQIKLAWKVHYPHQIQLEKKTSPPTSHQPPNLGT